LFISIFLTVVILNASYFLVKQNPDPEKLSAYECGFDPYENSRHTFNIKFCVIAIIFILFDIELMFLIPWIILISELNLLGIWSTIDFLFELGLGYLYIYLVTALDWY
jgi:NADH:ubiquinone oxidoreductase subunit 3 (subunit A)